MKQAFTIEIETLDNQSALRDFQIMAVLKNSFDEFFDGNARPLSAKESTVEQNCGTPENVNEKALDLLRRASDSLEEYHLEIMGRFGDSLATEIEEYVGRNTQGRTE